MANDFEQMTIEAANGVMPFSPEAEQSVLGAVLLYSSCLDQIA